MSQTDQEAAGELLGGEAISLTPVGFVTSPLKTPSLKADGKDLSQQRAVRRAENGVISHLVINREFSPLLDGIEEFSHLLVIYWPHLLPVKARATQKIHPAGFQDLPLTGVFATLSPARPNPLLATVVELLGREENLLVVKGLEAVDRTPVLDIKPYSRHYLYRDNARYAPWMEHLDRLFAQGEAQSGQAEGSA